ncbi:hypothetical protein [Nocardioides zeae]|uniref:Type IV toxin-antitoxin system AbiEi family antitoxin domain-containing protein n=1 Tax=Nocardioides zeae TaxID=1457234 RepID=A0AAJ1U1Y2_9ACTN|nr:hypothetical protein [Nocardioides zeae]MDQ1105884.1 hypothetical protein [Nocardioides zeae]
MSTSRGRRDLSAARARRAAGAAAVEQHLVQQDGVIARFQVLDAGWRPSDIARQLRRREWARLHDGVYLTHTGAPTWTQRAWAAVLWAHPAALCGPSALRAFEGVRRAGADDHDVVHVAIEAERRVVAPSGVTVRRRVRLDQDAQWNLGPPRVRYEEAVLDVAEAETTESRALGHVTDAVGARRTTADRLVTALLGRPRTRRRAWLLAALDDIRAGTSSVLEHAYLARVVRPHGLPEGVRQAAVASGGRVTYRDVDLPELGLVVELDGAQHHTGSADRARDLDRDLDAAADAGRRTVRLGWSQTHDRACVTAERLARILRAAGWTGRPMPCGTGCDLDPGKIDPPDGADLPIAS